MLRFVGWLINTHDDDDDDSPQFSAHVYYGQTAGWIKIPLGTEIGLGQGDFVLDGDPSFPLHRRHCVTWLLAATTCECRSVLLSDKWRQRPCTQGRMVSTSERLSSFRDINVVPTLLECWHQLKLSLSGCWQRRRTGRRRRVQLTSDKTSRV